MRDVRLEIVLAHAGLHGRRLGTALAERYAIRPTTSLAQTLAQLEQHAAHLLLLDLDLPDASGPLALARVRRSFPRLPIVALAGRVEETARCSGAQQVWCWCDVADWPNETFHARLAEVTGARGAPATAGASACRLLVAEHLTARRAALAKLLQEAGARVDLAADGLTALGKTLAAEDRGAPYSAVLLNTDLPGLGDSAAAALRDAGYRRPIIGLPLSEEESWPARPESEAASAIDAWLSAPFDRPTIIALLRRCGSDPLPPSPR